MSPNWEGSALDNEIDTLGKLLDLVTELAEKHGQKTPVYYATVGHEGHYLVIMHGDDPDDYTYINLETGRDTDV